MRLARGCPGTTSSLVNSLDHQPSCTAYSALSIKRKWRNHTFETYTDSIVFGLDWGKMISVGSLSPHCCWSIAHSFGILFIPSPRGRPFQVVWHLLDSVYDINSGIFKINGSRKILGWAGAFMLYRPRTEKLI